MASCTRGENSRLHGQMSKSKHHLYWYELQLFAESVFHVYFAVAVSKIELSDDLFSNKVSLVTI